MHAGQLDRLITLRTYTETVGVTGQPRQTWSDLAANVPANKRDVAGTERDQDGQEVARGSTLFTIRHRTDVNAKNRVSYGGIEYDVTFTKELGRKAWLEIHTQQRTDA